MLTPEDFKRKEEPVEQQPPAEEVVEAAPAPEAAPVPQAAEAATPTPEEPTPEEIALGQKDEDGNYQPTDNTAEKQSRDEGFIK